MQQSAFSLIELMVVIAIIAVISVVAVTSYRDYVIRSSVASLITLADKAKSDVEYAHNQGTVFGASGTQDYVAVADTGKPYGLISLSRVAYGCVNIDVDLAALNLDNTKILILTFCPQTNDSGIDWKCGYDATSSSDYINYLPSDCQQSSTAILDSSF